MPDGNFRQLGTAGIVIYSTAQLIIHKKQFKNAAASLVTGGIAAFTMLPASVAFRTNPPHQPLRQDTIQCRRHQKWFHTHIQQPGYRANGVIGVQCTKDQMPGQSGVDGNIGRLPVSNFPHQNNVRILTHN